MHNNTLFYKTVDFAPFQNTLSMLQSVLGGNTNERKKKMLKRNLLYAVYDLDLKLLRKYIRDFCFFFLHNLLPLPLLYKHLLSPITSSRNNSTLEKISSFFYFSILSCYFFCNHFLSLSLALNCLELVTWVIIVFVLYGSVKYACLNTEKEEKRTKISSSLPQSYFSRKGLKRARLL